MLCDDGTLWLNIGDSFSSGGNGGGPPGSKQATNPGAHLPPKKTPGYGAKQLLGVPWRLAFALQADGWILRQDIIWSKPNPMPESVRDRCTKAHEYLFLLSKGPRYYYDQDAVRERPSGRTDAITSFGKVGDARPALGGRDKKGGGVELDGLKGANRRSVWEVATQPFSEAHFATYPPALIEPCILAGCPGGGTVLDPFGGAGTTALVADRLQRDAILIELNPEYAEIAERRLSNEAGMFSDVRVAA